MQPIHKEMLLESLARFGRCDVVVGGTSMWPFIKPGDTVSICNKPQNPSPGMVVAFFVENQFVAHRIVWNSRIKSEGWKIFVHGDAAFGSWTQMNYDQVVGIVEYVQRGEDRISFWFANPLRIVTIPLGLMLQLVVYIKCTLKNNYNG